MALTLLQETAIDRTGTVVNAYLYLHAPVLVFEAALVSGVQRAKAFVALEVGVPSVGTWGAIRPEMMVQIDINGVADGGRQRVRGTDVGNSRILIGRAGTGRVDGRVTVNEGGTVRVYADYRPFIKAPFISPDNSEQYKDETLYTTANAAQPPVACAGTDRLVITNAASVTLALDALGDVPSFAVRNGASLASYEWVIGDGTVVTGTLASSALTASFPRGGRYISLKVTDSNGQTHTTHRLIAVASIAECVPVTIDSLTVTPSGNSISVTANSAYLPITVPTGAKVLLAEVENYSSTLIGYAERFSGWVSTETVTLTNARTGLTEVTLSLYDIGAFMRANYLFPQSLNIAVDTGGWYRMVKANIDRLMHYALQWHSNVLSLTSVKLSGVGTTYPFSAWTTSGGSFWTDLEELAQAFAHQWTVDCRNTLYVLPHPHVQPDATQAAAYSLPTQRPAGVVTTLTTNRYTRYDMSAHNDPSAYWLEGMALIANETISDVVSCIAPSNAPSFGTSGASRDSWLVTTQAELNVWAANVYISEYSPPVGDLKLSILSPTHFIEPALRQYVAVTLPAYVQARYNVPSASNNRWTVESITYSYGETGKRAEYVLKKEVVAPAPARNTAQTDATTTVQAWTGFDGSLPYVTGGTIQEFEGLMSLTNAEFRQGLSDLRLIATLSTRTAEEDVIILDGGDPSAPVDPDDTVTINEAITGGYYEIPTRINRFLVNARLYYLSIYVSGAPAEKTLFEGYVNSVLISADAAAVTAWSNSIFVGAASPTFPNLSLAQRQALTEAMYCAGSAQAGLTEFGATLTGITVPTFTRFNLFDPVLSTAQLAAWYDLGTARPLDFYLLYACTLAPTETVTANAAAINASSQVLGVNSHTWGTRADGTNIRIRASGTWEDTNTIKDTFYSLNKTTLAVTYSALVIYLRETSNPIAGASSVLTFPVQPPYVASGVYDVTAVTAVIGWPNLYAIDDNRAIVGTAVGSLSITFSDLGAR